LQNETTTAANEVDAIRKMQVDISDATEVDSKSVVNEIKPTPVDHEPRAIVPPDLEDLDGQRTCEGG
jgi:hypothetical protein